MLQENDLVLCTVKKIEGTTVFVDVEGEGEGNITFSEVSPGRIRNIREFVVPNKKIVCKVLRITGGHPELSLRRVSGKEREDVMRRYKKEKLLETLLKSTLKEKTPTVIKKISEKYDLAGFLDQAREKPEILSEFLSKSEAEKLEKIFVEKKEKEKEIKKTITIRSNSPSGIQVISHILETKDADIRYLGSSKFSITVKDKNFKAANTRIDAITKQMKDRAKQEKAELEIQ